MTHTNRAPLDTHDVFVFPQSRAQRRLWMLAELDPDSTAYAIPLALRVVGALDADALSRSLGALVRRHEILRTSYGAVDGQPMQFVHEDAAFELARETLARDALPARLAAEAATPFDLRRPQVLRAALFELAPDEHVLSLVIHHIACDGWSLDRIVGELDAQYAYETGAAAGAPDEPALQYGDYATWEIEAGDALTADVGFWADRLAPLAPFPFPRAADAAAPREPAAPSRRDAPGRTTQRALAAALAGRVEQCARDADTTPFVVLLAAFAALLHRASGATRLAIGTPVANRLRPEFEPMIGFFANTLVLDIDVSGEPDFATLVARCRGVVLEAFAHANAPFDEVARRHARDAVDTPLFHALFALQSAPLRTPRLGTLSIDVVPVYPAAAKFDLTLMLEPRADALHAALEHRCDVLDAQTADTWLASFADLVDAVLRTPHEPIARLPLPELAAPQPAVPSPAGPVVSAATRAGDGVGRSGNPDAAPRRTPPATPTERALADVWARILGREPGRDDSFFSLGGDSLSALRAIVEARGKGLHLTPAQMLGGVSLRALADALDREPLTHAPLAATRDAAGEPRADDALPPTPIIAWFAQLGLAAPNHWAQTIVVETAHAIAPEPLRDALRQLAAQHPALRQRVTLDAGRASVAFEPDDGGAQPAPDRFPLDVCTVASDDEARAVIASLAARLDLQHGPLSRAALIGRDGAPPLVALAVHHVAVDALSWSVLLHPLAAALGGDAPPPAPVASLAHWHRAASAAALAADPAPWLALAARGFAALPTQAGAVAPGFEADTRVDTWRLSPAQTTRLLDSGPAGARSRTQAILIASLCAALAPALDSERVALTLEHHGRDGEHGVDVSALVGWFTALSPIVLDDCLRDAPLDLLARAAHALAALAPRRHEYGLVRWLGASQDARQRLDAAGLPEISFNFLGVIGRPANGTFALRPDLIAGERDGANRRSFTLDVVASVIDGELRMDWRYSPKVLDSQRMRDAAQRWIARLDALLDAIAAAPRLAADHPLARLAQHELDELAPAVADAAIVASLTPLQEGMLFEASAHHASTAFHEQITAVVDGPLDLPRFVAAWQTMLARHDALRAGFVARAGGRPIQFVGAQAALPVTRLDWSDASAPAEQDARLAQWLRDDAAQPFDLSHPPLMRLAIATLGPQRHRWLWSFHHILLDGWSIPVFFRELIAIYAGRDAELPAPRRFADHLAWLALRAPGTAHDAWRARLAGLAPARLAAPARGPALHARRDVALTRAASGAIEQLARDAGVTPSTVFDAAWALLLARSGVGADVAFGVTLSGRSSGAPGADAMIGLFINTLPLRVTLAPAQTVRGLLARVQQALAELHASEHERLSDILRAAGADTNDLFDTLVVFENYPVEGDFAAPGGLVFARPEYHEHTNYPVTLAVIPGERFELRLEYDANRYPDAQAAALVERLARLVERFAATPDATLAEIGDEPVARQALTEPAGVPAVVDVPAPRDGSDSAPPLAHELFERAAARRPDAPALITPTDTLTYAALARRAGAIATRLRRLGAAPGTVVGMMLPRGVNAIASLLGILKAGAAYLPLDPHYPAARLGYMLRDAGARFVIGAAESGSTALDVDGIVTLHIADLLESGDESNDATAPLRAPPSSSLAYVIYTSGSTGEPKGVGVTHAGIANMCRAMHAGFAVDAQSRIFLFPPLTFDASVAEIFTALSNGAALVLPPEGAKQSDTSSALIDAARAGRVTHVTLPPSLLAALDDADLAGVRTIVAAGEAAPAGLLARWARGRRVVNAYGPSEATVCASLHVCDTHEPLPPIGAGIEGVRTVVLDEWLGAAPVGVAGEICVGGPALARGYLGRPGLTAASFIPDPAAAEPGARLYRTGDRGILLADGTIRYLGRAGGHVKLRGYRIDPDGIAGVLLRDASVREALVDVTEYGRRPELTAFVIPRDATLDVDALRAHAARALAPHEVPARFVVVPDWPLTSSGKIDRATLRDAHAPAPRTDAAADAVADAPRDDVERWVRDAFRQVLGVPDARVDDDYFALGGDSILALQVGATMLRHGIKIGAGEVLELRTPRAIADVCRARVAADARALAPEPEPEAADVPLAPIQRWFLERGGATPRRFTIDVRLAFAAPPDPDALARALAALALRHDALRLRVEHRDDGWRQHYAARDGAALLPLAIAPAPLADDAALAAYAATLQAGLDPVRGPAARAGYVPHGPAGAPELIVVAHHLVMDVASWRILLADLDACYGAARRGEAPPAMPRTTSYRRWNDMLAATAGARETERGFWETMLAATPRDADDTLGAPGRVDALDHVRLAFDAELTARLNGPLNRVHDTRTQELLLAALAHAWGRWTNGAALRLDVEGHGRQVPAGIDADLSQTVGWFTCVYPLRIDSGDDWDASIARVKTLLRAVPDGGVGYGVLARHGALVDAHPRAVSWNYLGTAADGDAGALPELGARVAAGGLPDGRAPGDPVLHPLAIDAAIAAGALSIRFAYSGARRDAAAPPDIGRLAALTDDAIRSLSNHLAARLDALPAAPQPSAPPLPGGEQLRPAELDALLLDLTDTE
ncbi:amino acid adenylation domain-containing protein [Burkholderia sp. Bp9002]|nr:amino acid adenylation domain-containing protein [Burkholderia sp. Bp9125]RQS03743.1 amino acid adenylation domain-containing protein [Burkholderia sp. Bp9002]